MNRVQFGRLLPWIRRCENVKIEMEKFHPFISIPVDTNERIIFAKFHILSRNSIVSRAPFSHTYHMEKCVMSWKQDEMAEWRANKTTREMENIRIIIYCFRFDFLVLANQCSCSQSTLPHLYQKWSMRRWNFYRTEKNLTLTLNHWRFAPYLTLPTHFSSVLVISFFELNGKDEKREI